MCSCRVLTGVHKYDYERTVITMKLPVSAMLKIAAESCETGSFNDALSATVSSVEKRYSSMRILSDEELGLVAGGVNLEDQLKEAVLKNNNK